MFRPCSLKFLWLHLHDFLCRLKKSQNLLPFLQWQLADTEHGMWRLQEAKASALGPKHDTSRLASVVAEPWLTVVTQEATAAQESGWFWEYDLKSVSVSLCLALACVHNPDHALHSFFLKRLCAACPLMQ